MRPFRRRRPVQLPTVPDGFDPEPETAPPIEWPRLRVWHDRYAMPCRWDWQVTTPDGGIPEQGSAPTHAGALAIGLAYLAVVTASWAIDELGAELPPGWERITP